MKCRMREVVRLHLIHEIGEMILYATVAAILPCSSNHGFSSLITVFYTVPIQTTDICIYTWQIMFFLSLSLIQRLGQVIFLIHFTSRFLQLTNLFSSGHLSYLCSKFCHLKILVDTI